MGDTNIEWTQRTWNPVRGCTRVSPGCFRCYAEREANRHKAPGEAYEGLVQITNGHPQWTGKIRLVEDKLQEPMKWRSPKRIFTNSMSDLFHESVPFEFIDKVYGVIGLAKRHTFQILTKRPQRALEYFQSRDWNWAGEHFIELPWASAAGEWVRRGIERAQNGVSVEDQPRACERIPTMLQWATGGAVKWISAEPLLGPVELGRICRHAVVEFTGKGMRPSLDWVVCGGESGPGARLFDLAWARKLRDECSDAGIPFFLKQLGSSPHSIPDKISHKHDPTPKPGGFYRYLWDSKGGNPEEWPEDLRVRQYPQEVASAQT